jgi:hypothetical protein
MMPSVNVDLALTVIISQDVRLKRQCCGTCGYCHSANWRARLQ